MSDFPQWAHLRKIQKPGVPDAIRGADLADQDDLEAGPVSAAGLRPAYR
jgi:hypothetical protein